MQAPSVLRTWSNGESFVSMGMFVAGDLTSSSPELSVFLFCLIHVSIASLS